MSFQVKKGDKRAFESCAKVIVECVSKSDQSTLGIIE